MQILWAKNSNCQQQQNVAHSTRAIVAFLVATTQSFKGQNGLLFSVFRLENSWLWQRWSLLSLDNDSSFFCRLNIDRCLGLDQLAGPMGATFWSFLGAD